MLSPKEFVILHLKKLDEYINGVQSGKIVAGKLQRQAVERFIEHKQQFIYKEQELRKFLKFCSLLSMPLDNQIQQVSLVGWQVFTVANLYCLYKEDQRTRLYTQAYIQIAKKQGKTSFCSILMLYDCLFDNELKAEITLVAISREQATIAFKIIKSIIDNSPIIKPLFTGNRHTLINKDGINDNIIQVKANQKNGVQGLNNSTNLVDEYAFHTDSTLQDRLLSGQIARHNPLQIIITTASNDRNSPAFALRETCINILSKTVHNNSIFCLIFELDSKEDINNSDQWIKANPSLGVTVQLSSLVREYESAKLLPSKLNSFLTDNLNLWSDNLLELWIEDEVIKSLMVGHADHVLKPNLETFIGLDLSATSDLTSIGILQFDNEQNKFLYECINIFPNNDKKRIRTGSIDLTQWIKEGHIIEHTHTPIIDEDDIYDRLADLSNKYNVVSIGYDPWGSKQLINKLHTTISTDVNPIPQTIKELSYPLKEVEKVLLTNKIVLKQNPVLRWMFSNVKLYRDLNHNIKIDKRKGEAVDSVVALNMCMHEYLSYNGEGLEGLADSYNYKK